VATTAINMFTFGDTSANMHDSTRHKGITINKINGYGSYVALSFIKSTTAKTHDNIHVTRNMIMGFTDYAIIQSWDTNMISENQIQSNTGGGISRDGGYSGFIVNNVIYDNGGIAISITSSQYDTISGNKLGSGDTGVIPTQLILSGGSGVVFGNVLYARSPAINKVSGLWIIYGNYGSETEYRDLLMVGATKTSMAYNAGFMTLDAMAADVGGKLALGGRYSTTDPAFTPFGAIVGRKENATNDNGRGYLGFWTTDTVSPYSHERMRIKSTGVINMSALPTYADNATAVSGGLVAGDIYKTATGELRIIV
jgi:hypothetical protein